MVSDVAIGLPTAMCEGRMLTKQDVKRWVVRTMPNRAGTDWSFTVRGSTIEDWKRQVVQVLTIRRGHVEVADKQDQKYILDEEMSNDTGWLTLEEFSGREIRYVEMPYSLFIKETKCLDENDVGKTFVRAVPFGGTDRTFMPKFHTSIDWNQVEVKAYKPGSITVIPYFGFKTTLKQEYALSNGWIELEKFKAAIVAMGFPLQDKREA